MLVFGKFGLAFLFKQMCGSCWSIKTKKQLKTYAKRGSLPRGLGWKKMVNAIHPVRKQHLPPCPPAPVSCTCGKHGIWPFWLVHHRMRKFGYIWNQGHLDNTSTEWLWLGFDDTQWFLLAGTLRSTHSSTNVAPRAGDRKTCRHQQVLLQ